MSYELTGKLHKTFDTEKKGDTFRSREFVVFVPGDYPQYVKFQVVQDRCDQLDNIPEGADIKVFFDLRGREWQGKYFTNLNAWKVEYSEQSRPVGSTGSDLPF